jgi:hypothetical protein
MATLTSVRTATKSKERAPEIVEVTATGVESHPAETYTPAAEPKPAKVQATPSKSKIEAKAPKAAPAEVAAAAKAEATAEKPAAAIGTAYASTNPGEIFECAEVPKSTGGDEPDDEQLSNWKPEPAAQTAAQMAASAGSSSTSAASRVLGMRSVKASALLAELRSRVPAKTK